MTETAMEGERGAASRALRGLGRFLLRTKLYWGLIVLVAVGVFSSPVNSHGVNIFLSPGNLSNVLRQVSNNGIGSNGIGSYTWTFPTTSADHSQIVYVTATDSNGLKGQIPFSLTVNGAPNTAPVHATETLPLLVYRQMFGLFDTGAAASVAVLMLLFLLLLAIAYLQLATRGERVTE